MAMDAGEIEKLIKENEDKLPEDVKTSGVTPAALTATNPAERYGLGATKGSLEIGKDADIALVDTDQTWTVRAEESVSTQEYTPFEGQTLTAKVTDTFVRGHHVMADGVVGDLTVGRYLARPTA